ncbi:hypothetical protein [Dictyobacter halimunensis]|uniref:hypothetical protein n=1 Tax=Dictyobacter halimunensis TaxID=3026934 RepID=UPI0030C67464
MSRRRIIVYAYKIEVAIKHISARFFLAAGEERSAAGLLFVLVFQYESDLWVYSLISAATDFACSGYADCD